MNIQSLMEVQTFSSLIVQLSWPDVQEMMIRCSIHIDKVMSITIFKVSSLNGRSLGSVRRIATIGLWYITVYLHLCLYLLQTHIAWWVEDLCNPDISCTAQTRPAWSMCSKTNIPTPWPVHSIAITLARPVTLYSCHNVLLNPSSCTVLNFVTYYTILQVPGDKMF